MSVDNLLFPEMELKAGDCINGKGKRLYSKDIYEGLIFVQQHSNIFLICRCEKIGGQVIYSSGGYDKNYTRKQFAALLLEMQEFSWWVGTLPDSPVHDNYQQVYTLIQTLIKHYLDEPIDRQQIETLIDAIELEVI